MRHVDFSPLYRSTVGFDRLFTMLDSLAQPENGQTYPPYNIERTGEDAYRISMAVAGFSEDDISIEAHRNVLTVKGEKKQERKEEQKGWHLSERSYGSFYRAVPLPPGTEADKASAEFKKGVLTVRLPKSAQAQQQTRRIEVKGG